ncbi:MULTISPECIES: restriction endonuclease [Cupriavidus]|jgi:restriction system protein|uniref:DNA topoisomerase n=1 Tax=Cupriavidus metallidurans TaxID=119219 RepID=A0A482IL55_9BURK|nr:MULTISPECIES: restriction endonuclease [Cupriavidus]KWR83520.1 DNA topoisomerase [Cupriavidus sp. SHE]QBP08676.1 DNA topoisomerase [Cupriavidus metallidurans]QWC89097.1 restriction endonuclease [Cupriavidus metallidurans]
MGRRRRKPSLSDVLMDAPWWASVVLALGSYIVFHAVVPAAFARSPFLIGLAMTSRSLAWVPATMFGSLGLLAYLRARKRQAEGNSGSGGARPMRKERSLRVVRTSAPVTKVNPGATDRIDEAISASGQQTAHAKPTEWTIDALGQLEWKRFEMLCVWYYEAMGFTVKTVPHGADGGIDATLYKDGMATPIAVVQCKAWRSPVKVEPVRALGGSMHSTKVKRGVFWSLAGFIGQPVQTYAAEAGIQLLDGAGIVERISALDADKQARLLARAFEGDYQTPTCAACGVKLVARDGKGGPFWGCRNYPKGCRVRLPRGA